MNSGLVNWLPWSVLNTSGFPRACTCCKASMQKPASSALDSYLMATR